MSKSFLEKLEFAFADYSAIDSEEARQLYLHDLEQEDPKLAAELGQITLTLENQRDGMDLSVASFLSLDDGFPYRKQANEAYVELVQLLKVIRASKNPEALGELEGFEIQKLVGIGPFGFVFQAWDQNLKRQVAIKVLSPSIANDPQKKALFVDEARLTSSIHSPNVATIFHVHFSTEPNLAFFVMEWIEGSSLKEWIERNHEESPAHQEPTVVEHFCQLIKAVDEIHAKGIVHGDLKPGNVLVENETNRLVVVDFGLAFENDDDQRKMTPGGTPLFMSPEQMQGQAATANSDQFALAEITCLMFYGFHPHRQESFEALTDHVLRSTPDIPDEPLISAAAKQVLLRALAKEPTQRFDTVKKFGKHFLVATGHAEEVDTDSLTHRSRHSTATRLHKEASVANRVAAILAVLFFCVAVYLAIESSVFQPSKDSSSKSTLQKSEQPGRWLDEEQFENFAGVKFKRLKYDGRNLKVWPPDPAHPELFAELGWRNMNMDLLVSESLIDQEVFDAVMENRSVKPSVSSKPVTGISLSEAEEFCKRLSDRDPDGMRYLIGNVNTWAFATYGKSILVDKVPTVDVLKSYSAKDGNTYPFSQLSDAFAGNLEWTVKEKRPTTRLDGIVPFVDQLPTTADRFVEVVGGSQKGLFVHAFDMNFGINDHFHSSTGLQFHLEEDGETCYLHPSQINEEASLVYEYRVPKIVSAHVRTPFSLFSERSRAGIRIRGKHDSEKKPLNECEWAEVYEVDGKHFPQANHKMDVTKFVKGCTEIQIQYWIKSEDKRLFYSQFGRTSLHQCLPNVCWVELMTENDRASPRQSFIIPSTFKSQHISFRIVAIPPKENGKTN